MQPITILIIYVACAFTTIGVITLLSNHFSLNKIRSKTVGDGQHGVARFATAKEIHNTYKHIPYKVNSWRKGKNLPTDQGLVLGSIKDKFGNITALVDTDDVHCLMIGASGTGKTAYFLYPNLEYACASGMSWICTDTKGDLAKNYGTKQSYPIWLPNDKWSNCY